MVQELNQIEIETERIEAGLEHVVDRIERQYKDRPIAFQKEAIQNAWDARTDRNEAKDWSVKIDYEQNRNHIIIEDYGTLGMNPDRWKAFLALWKPKKQLSDAGGQGQGKFVLMGASNHHVLIVESKSKEIPYKCRYLRGHEKDRDNRRYTITDFMPGVSLLNHLGTKIWVYDVRKDFLKTVGSENFMQEIAATWWQILSKPFNAKVLFLGKEIILPKLPPISKSKIVLENRKVGEFGRIKKLALEFYEKDLPGLFTGVRVQRAQMTIVKIPFEIYDKEYKNRFSGYITFDEDLEAALKSIERTDHCSFAWESPWKEIKKLVSREAENFKNEFIPKKGKRKSLNAKLHNEIVTKANQILRDHLPDVVHGEGSEIPKIERKKPPALRIDSLTVEKKEVKYNEVVKPSCMVKNGTSQLQKVLLRVELKYHTGTKINKEEYAFKIKPEKKQPLILSPIKLENHYQKGKYTIRATLQQERKDKHSKATSFYLETKRSPIKSGFIKKVDFYELPDHTIRNERIKKGSLTINTEHPDFSNIEDSFASKPQIANKQIIFYAIKITLDEGIRAAFKQKYKGGQEIDIDSETDELMNVRDRMYYQVYI